MARDWLDEALARRDAATEVWRGEKPWSQEAHDAFFEHARTDLQRALAALQAVRAALEWQPSGKWADSLVQRERLKRIREVLDADD